MCFMFVFVLPVPCGLVVTCWEGPDVLALLCIMFFLYSCHFPIWYPGPGVVLNCVNSLSLPSSLLRNNIVGQEKKIC